jgi:hypothetical protein
MEGTELIETWKELEKEIRQELGLEQTQEEKKDDIKH